MVVVVVVVVCVCVVVVVGESGACAGVYCLALGRGKIDHSQA